MKENTLKALNLSNVLLGIGILLLIVPVGFILLTLATASENQTLAEEINSLGWIVLIILSLVPVGLGCFVGGLSWMVYLKRKAKAEEIEEDDAADEEEK